MDLPTVYFTKSLDMKNVVVQRVYMVIRYVLQVNIQSFLFGGSHDLFDIDLLLILLTLQCGTLKVSIL